MKSQFNIIKLLGYHIHPIRTITIMIIIWPAITTISATLNSSMSPPTFLFPLKHLVIRRMVYRLDNIIIATTAIGIKQMTPQIEDKIPTSQKNPIVGGNLRFIAQAINHHITEEVAHHRDPLKIIILRENTR